MARLNWNAVEREEQAIEEAFERGEITMEEFHRQLNDLHRSIREEYEEQQIEERRNEFDW